jgi:hypothetical protein
MATLTRAQRTEWHQKQVQWIQRFEHGCGDPGRIPGWAVADLAYHREALAQLQQEAAAHQIVRQAAGPWGSR